MKRFTCQTCGNEVYFANTRCVHCNAHLGFEPARAIMLSAPDGEDWRAPDDPGIVFRVCANISHSACNWLVPASEPETLCLSCRHNKMIPNLADPHAAELWRALEAAKRVMFYSLIRWRLPMPTMEEDPARGLAFSFLADEVLPDGSVKQHMTGHADGLITINIAEGDDAERERRRTEMNEPYRTLVGHFRHEIGHYYWDRLVADQGREADFRALFGDEREDYAAALQRHYSEGAPPDWQNSFISTYATAHPWEDFAETFAHYCHIVDSLETAAAFGLHVAHLGEGGEVRYDPYVEGTEADLIASWVPLTVAMNAINRSMGQPDLYPFVLSTPVEEKLGFIHDLIRAARASAARAARNEIAMHDQPSIRP
ncbi:putative zinc-binding peptidase [Acuticoccus sp. M5D2P5]|uniref:zinc-binding metallopeptidase family protein n=1 Tax=Acuticoccus kalidii TaxID=2910977 RepID=UPI001F185ABB|nr:putative zinc-binding peptidase [Acuticoccus kalidii]MCF3933646.1 putative zinc-binding peptidase [Acuticoccus kalidii]